MMGVDFRIPRAPDWPWLAATFRDTGLFWPGQSIEDAAQRLRGGLAYLATPYSQLARDGAGSWNRNASDGAVDLAACWSAWFAMDGVMAASPVVLSASMVHAMGPETVDPFDQVFWARWCQPLLAVSSAVAVPMVEGWSESRGVWRACCYAARHQRPVVLMVQP
ncbi:DUF1937 family protein [Mesobaculum littorinae]|uniref:DUF1937 family protein n=1 Tax=Mesobaculum littorinae TaxID=2486419 RepID=A0A438ALT9_9RHOB|nr:DUF1937 family protein [Mesobaculum littorinae]RVV99718.1 DUF1937 family protein [Mesobaculum littorinae]